MQGTNPMQHSLLPMNNMTNMTQMTPSQPNMMQLLMCLQQTINKQNMLLQLLFQQQQRTMNQTQTQVPKDRFGMLMLESSKQREEINFTRLQVPQQEIECYPTNNQWEENDAEGLNVSEDSDFIPKKEEFCEGLYALKTEDTIDTDLSHDDTALQKSSSDSTSFSLEMKNLEDEQEVKKKTYFKIIRRNDFKASNIAKMPRKSNKNIIPKKEPAKAKHLWINYGRKIIEFALHHINDESRVRVKQLNGKLGSKKDFKEVFGLKVTDSESDKIFKILFAKLALFFIEHKADAAFDDSKYKSQMIMQKSAIASWIKKLLMSPVLESKAFNFDEKMNLCLNLAN